MKLGGGEVRAIAAEARLSLTDAELDGTVRYIGNFLDMLDRFKELDLKDVKPFSFEFEAGKTFECPLREDEPVVFDKAGEILAERNCGSEGAFFKVPRILEE